MSIAPADTPERASDSFAGACADTVKAWHQGRLLSMANPQVLARMRESLVQRDANKVCALWIEIMGPVAPAQIKDALNHSAKSHADMAAMVATQALRLEMLRVFVRIGGCAPAIDLERVKSDLMRWIDVGEFTPASDDVDSEDGEMSERTRAQAVRMADVLKDAAYPAANAQRIRLALLAPLAPALQSMIVLMRAPPLPNLVPETTVPQVAEAMHS